MFVPAEIVNGVIALPFSFFIVADCQYNTSNQALPLASTPRLFPADFKVETFLKVLADQ